MKGRVVACVMGVAVALLGAGAFFFLTERATSGFRFIMLFDEARGVTAGSTVFHNGVPVGEVCGVSLTQDGQVSVEMRLAEPENLTVPVNCTGVIAEGKLPDGKYGSYVDLKMPQKPGPPLTEGGTVEGLNNRIEIWAWEGSNAFGRLIDKQSQAIEEGAEELRRFADSLNEEISSASDDVEKVVADIEKIATDLEKKGAEAADAIDKALTDIEDDIETLIDELERVGKSEPAQELKRRRDDLEKRLQSLKQDATTQAK